MGPIFLFRTSTGMIELFWIKSLISFLVVCLCSLSWAILITHKKEKLVRRWRLPLAVWTILYLLAFLRFTTWIYESGPYIDAMYNSGLSLTFLLGPLVHMAFDRSRKRTVTVLNSIVFLSAFVFTWLYKAGSLYILLSLLYSTAYFCWILFGPKHGSLTLAGRRFLNRVLSLWSIAFLIQCLELVLWAQWGLIAEETAWMLYIVSNLFLCSSFLFLTYNFGMKHFEFEKKTQPKLPDGIEDLLNKDLIPYLRKPEVYSNPLIDLKRVAKDLNVSPHHISTFLNHHYGKGFVSIINDQRIDEVIEKLEDPGN